MKKIPVIFGIDNSYLFQAFVTMASILEHSHSQYHFIIITKSVNETEFNELSQGLKKYYSDFFLSVQKIRDSSFDNVKICNYHLSEATLYRLLIPELVTEYKKCIYLDSDILVNGDLKQLFTMDLGDSYLGGVKDCHLVSKHETRHQKYLGIPSLDTYINAGVLLMNLQKIREDDLVTTFLKQVQKENLYEDQDVLNLCCYGHIKTLPIKYNLFHFYQGLSIKELFELPYTKKDFLFDWESPHILHMGGRFKPWMDRRYKGAGDWWRIAEIYKDSGLYQFYSEKCDTGYGEAERIKRIFEVCRKKKSIILWGYSEQGMDVFDVFVRNGITIHSFCDNDKRKQGRIYRGAPVLDIEEELKEKEDALWIITCKKAYKEVYEQLTGLGVDDQNIEHFTYNNKGKMYYLALEKKYYKEEIKVIALCENDINEMSGEAYLKYVEQLIEEEDMHNETYRTLYYKYRFDLWLKC